MNARRTTRTFLLMAVTLCLAALSPPASADSPGERCREACRARNVDHSCAWLSMQPRRCLAHSLQECRRQVREGMEPVCPLPPDLPACLTNQSCPYGALCADSTCQVVACTGPDDVVSCPGHQRCADEHCVVDDCQGATQNCPAGSHCSGEGLVSGRCEPNDPTRVACMTDTDCIAAGNFNPRCLRGVCASRPRRRACETDSDCFEACKTSVASVRIPRCNSAGQCVCANCESGAQCDARFSCQSGQSLMCRANGTCFCPPTESPPPGGGGSVGVCTSFEMPPCTPCRTDADCGGGFDVCLQSAHCDQAG